MNQINSIERLMDMAEELVEMSKGMDIEQPISIATFSDGWAFIKVGNVELKRSFDGNWQVKRDREQNAD